MDLNSELNYFSIHSSENYIKDEINPLSKHTQSNTNNFRKVSFSSDEIEIRKPDNFYSNEFNTWLSETDLRRSPEGGEDVPSSNMVLEPRNIVEMKPDVLHHKSKSSKKNKKEKKSNGDHKEEKAKKKKEKKRESSKIDAFLNDNVSFTERHENDYESI